MNINTNDQHHIPPTNSRLLLNAKTWKNCLVLLANHQQPSALSAYEKQYFNNFYPNYDRSTDNHHIGRIQLAVIINGKQSMWYNDSVQNPMICGPFWMSLTSVYRFGAHQQCEYKGGTYASLFVSSGFLQFLFIFQI